MTSDGYVITIHRIPFSQKSPKDDTPKPPVCLMHAFMESSNGWIVLGPEHSLGKNNLTFYKMEFTNYFLNFQPIYLRTLVMMFGW